MNSNALFSGSMTLKKDASNSYTRIKEPKYSVCSAVTLTISYVSLAVLRKHLSILHSWIQMAPHNSGSS